MRGVGDTSEFVATTWSLSFKLIEQANPAAAELLRACAFLDPDAIPEDLLIEGSEAFSSVLAPVIADPFAFNQAIEELRKFSLIRRNAESRTVSVHRLVQAVLRDEVTSDMQREWAERIIRVVESAYPNVVFENWGLCRLYQPHAVVCAQLIEQYQVVSIQAAQLLNAMGDYLYEQGFYSQAHLYLQQALILANELQGEREEQDVLSLALNNLALLYLDQGKFELAEPLLQRALAIYEHSLGPHHPYTATTLNNLGRLYLDQGKFELAEPLYQRALAIYEQAYGLDDPKVATDLEAYAELLVAMEQGEEAERLLNRARGIRAHSDSSKGEGNEGNEAEG